MRRRFVKIDPGDAVLEFASIVLAILLALAVNNWQAGLRERAQLRANVAMVVGELEANQRMLLAVNPRHEREARAIARRVDRDMKNGAYISFEGFFAYFISVAPNGLGPIHIQDGAWQIARSDASISAMSSADRLELGRIYEQQGQLRDFSDALSAQVESMHAGNMFPTIANMALIFGDLVPTEEQLEARYTQMISRLRNTYDVPP
jgi:hypothetical protein